MKKIAFYVLIFAIHISLLPLGLSFYVYAQTPTLEWDRKYPNINTFHAGAYALVVDKSGNAYITGYSDSANSSYCTIKYSSSGVREWIKYFTGPNSGGRFAFAIALDSFNNIYVTGYSFNEGHYFDYCTIKYDSNGVQQWYKYYNGPANGIDQAQKIAIDKAGNIYVTGFSSLYGGFSFQITTIKYSPEGDEIWTQRYGNADGSTYANAMVIDEDCNIYITGANHDSSATIKYDSSGNLLWSGKYAMYGGAAEAKDIKLDKDNNVFISGGVQLYSCNVLRWDFFTIKYSSNGIQQWIRRYNPDSCLNVNNNAYYANSVEVDNIGNVYVSGSYSTGGPTKLCTIKYSNIGDVIWIKKDDDTLRSDPLIDIDRINNIYIAYSFYLWNQYPYKTTYSVMKYDENGTTLWKQNYPVKGDNTRPYDLNVNEDFDIYLTGAWSNRTLTIKYSQPVGIKTIGNGLPVLFKLFQNYPNPFNSNTNIKFQIPEMSNIKIAIYNILGEQISFSQYNNIMPGIYELDWYANDNPSGVYFYQIETNKYKDSKKMILLR